MPVLNLGEPEKNYPPAMLDKFCGKKLVVVGGARCVWTDMASINCRPSESNNDWHVMCINDIVMHYPGRIDHFYSNDHRWMPHWAAARRELHVRKFGPIRHCHSCRTGAKYNWPWPGHGSSALGAVYCGLAMGYDKIVLCGVPLDDSGHYFDPPWTKTNFRREIGTMSSGEMMYWQNAKSKIFEGRVFGTSGRTGDLLGRYN